MIKVLLNSSFCKGNTLAYLYTDIEAVREEFFGEYFLEIRGMGT